MNEAASDREHPTAAAAHDGIVAGRQADALAGLARLHADVDAGAASLASVHAARLQCRRGCAGCCQDDLTVFEVEAERIRRAHGELLHGGRPHPHGACAFLASDGACRIYAERPYVCRTQGLPLRWLEEREAPAGAPAGGQVVELRAMCPLNEPEDAAPVEALTAEACWTIGPHEERLARLEAHFQGDGARARVALRSLFAR